VRAHDVPESMEEIVAEMRRTDETPTLATLNAGAAGGFCSAANPNISSQKTDSLICPH